MESFDRSEKLTIDIDNEDDSRYNDFNTINSRKIIGNDLPVEYNRINENINDLNDEYFKSMPSGVVSINLHGNRLTTLSSISPHYHRFRCLTDLNLSSNQFNNSNIPELAYLPLLLCLDLSGNLLKSVIDFPFLPSLKVIRLSFNKIDNLCLLDENCPNLEEIDIRGNKLSKSEDISSISGLKYIKKIEFGYNNNSVVSIINPLCADKFIVRDLFDKCTSLCTVDGMMREDWEDATTNETIMNAIKTPKFDLLKQKVKAIRESNNSLSHDSNPWSDIRSIRKSPTSLSSRNQPESFPLQLETKLLQSNLHQILDASTSPIQVQPSPRLNTSTPETKCDLITSDTSTSTIHSPPRESLSSLDKQMSSPPSPLVSGKNAPSTPKSNKSLNCSTGDAILVENATNTSFIDENSVKANILALELLESKKRQNLIISFLHWKYTTQYSKDHKESLFQREQLVKQEYETKISELLAQVESNRREHESTIQQEKAVSLSLSKRVSQLEVSLSSSRKRLQDDSNKFSMEKSELARRIHELEQINETIRNDKDKMKMDYDSLRVESQILQETLRDQQSVIKSQANELSNKDMQINEVLKSLRECEARNSSSGEELKLLRGQISSLKLTHSNDLKQLSDKISAEESESNRLKSRLIKVQEVLESMKQSNESLESENQTLRKIIQDLSVDIKLAKRQLKELQINQNERIEQCRAQYNAELADEKTKNQLKLAASIEESKMSLKNEYEKKYEEYENERKRHYEKQLNHYYETIEQMKREFLEKQANSMKIVNDSEIEKRLIKEKLLEDVIKQRDELKTKVNELMAININDKRTINELTRKYDIVVDEIKIFQDLLLGKSKTEESMVDMMKLLEIDDQEYSSDGEANEEKESLRQHE